MCRTGHGTDIAFVNANCHTVAGGNKQPVGAVGQTHCGDLVALVQTNGDQAVLPHVLIVRQCCPLDLTIAGDHDHILALVEVRRSEYCGDLFSGVQGQ